MVFVPTLDVDAHAGRVWARELVRLERWALVASESGSSDSNPRPAPAAAARRTVGANSLQPEDVVVVDARGILGAGLLHATSAPARSTALVGV